MMFTLVLEPLPLILANVLLYLQSPRVGITRHRMICLVLDVVLHFKVLLLFSGTIWVLLSLKMAEIKSNGHNTARMDSLTPISLIKCLTLQVL